MVTLVAPMPLPGLVALVNGWGSVPRKAAGEEGEPFPGRPLLLAQIGVRRNLIPRSNAALAAVADELHPVFAASSPAERVAVVNRLLATAAVRPALYVEGSAIEASWLVDDVRQALLAAAALALRSQLADQPPNRLGVCAGDRCVNAYVDISPSGQRRFCSVSCQNRTRVAAFRRRKTDRRSVCSHADKR